MTAAKPLRRRRLVGTAVLLAAAGLATAAVVSGCPERPRAPLLTNSAVFQDEAIGLRFLVPEGWSIVSRIELPRGTLPRALVVVSYALSQADHPAEPVGQVRPPRRHEVEHRCSGREPFRVHAPERLDRPGLEVHHLARQGIEDRVVGAVDPGERLAHATDGTGTRTCDSSLLLT